MTRSTDSILRVCSKERLENEKPSGSGTRRHRILAKTKRLFGSEIEEEKSRQSGEESK